MKKLITLTNISKDLADGRKIKDIAKDIAKRHNKIVNENENKDIYDWIIGKSKGMERCR